MAFKQGDSPVFKIGDLVLLEGVVEETRDPGNIVVNLSPKGKQTHHLSFHRNVLDALDLSRGLRQSVQDEEPVPTPIYPSADSPEGAPSHWLPRPVPATTFSESNVNLASNTSVQVGNFTLSGNLEPPDAAVGAPVPPDDPDPVPAGNAAEIPVPEPQAP